MTSKTRNQIIGERIIDEAYAILLERGRITQAELAELTGANPQTLGSKNTMRFNAHQRERGRIHLFTHRVEARRVVWYLRERKAEQAVANVFV